MVSFATSTAAALLALAGVAHAAGDVAAEWDAACGSVRIDPASLQWVDACGRQRFFRGWNTVMKGPPYYPQLTGFDPVVSLSTVDAALIRSLGGNVVRLGAMWPGVMPSEGMIDTTYLAVLTNLSTTLGSYGVFSLLDAHQDSLAESTCGEGVPDWLVRASTAATHAAGFPLPLAQPYPINSTTGFPSNQDCGSQGWANYYFADAVGKAFQYFYTGPGVVSAGQFWAAVAQAYTNSPAADPWVLAYELINEPWAGDVIGDILLMAPGVADRVNLQPFYENVTAAIRAAEAPGRAHPIAVETVTWDDFLPAGFDSLPGASEGLAALSWHYYAFPEGPNIEGIDWHIQARLADMQRLGIGGLLTEFEFGGEAANITTTAAACDQALQGYIAWEYKLFDPITGANAGVFNGPNFTLAIPQLTAFSRTWPMAVAGRVKPGGYSFDAATAFFSLNYTLDASSPAPTVVFIQNALIYGNAAPPVSVSSTPANAVTYQVTAYAGAASGEEASPRWMKDATHARGGYWTDPQPLSYSLLTISAAPGATNGAQVFVTVG